MQYTKKDWGILRFHFHLLLVPHSIFYSQYDFSAISDLLIKVCWCLKSEYRFCIIFFLQVYGSQLLWSLEHLGTAMWQMLQGVHKLSSTVFTHILENYVLIHFHLLYGTDEDVHYKKHSPWPSLFCVETLPIMYGSEFQGYVVS